jgi:phosphate-selective porin OprO/OprP
MKWITFILTAIVCSVVALPLFADNGVEGPSIDGYQQFRMNYYKPDTDADSYDVWFNLAYGRVGVKGTMYNKLATYRVLVAYEGGTVRLFDFFVVLNAHEAVKVQVGQFKVPFTRQYYQSAKKHSFTTVSLPVNYLNDGRDIGIELFCTDLRDGMIEYHLGVFNGNGSNLKANDNTDFEVAGKALAKFGTINPGQEGFHPQESGVAIGFSGFMNHTGADTTGEERMGIAAEATAGSRGFFVTGEYVQLTRTIGDTDVTSGGFYGQVSYMVMPKRLELVGRYAQYDPNGDADDDLMTEIRGGVVFYHSGHNHKLGLEGVQITQQVPGGDVSSMGAATYYQFSF